MKKNEPDEARVAAGSMLSTLGAMLFSGLAVAMGIQTYHAWHSDSPLSNWKNGSMRLRHFRAGHKNGGEGGIRTPGTSCPVRRFSKPLPSATQPPLRVEERAPQPKSIGADMRQTCLNIPYFTLGLQDEFSR